MHDLSDFRSAEILNSPRPPTYDPVGDLLSRMRPGDWVRLPHASARLLEKTAQKRHLPITCEPISEMESSVTLEEVSRSFAIEDVLETWRKQRPASTSFSWLGTAVELLDEICKIEVLRPFHKLSARVLGKYLVQASRCPGSGVTVSQSNNRWGNEYRIDVRTTNAEALSAQVEPEPEILVETT